MMSQRPTTKLHNILNDKIDFYESKDNPVPKNGWQTFIRFFHQCGASGRKTAKALRYTINHITDELELGRKILDEMFSKDGLLRKSHSLILTRRILEGYCDYFDFDMAEINERAKENTLYHNAAASELSDFTTYDEQRDRLMLISVKVRTRWRENKYDQASEMQGAIEMNVRRRY